MAERLITGLQPVREAIRVHGAALLRVVVEQRDAPKLDAVARFASDQGVTVVERRSRAELDKLSAGAQHQGVVAFAPPLALVPPETLLTDPNLIALALDGIQDPQNFGAVIRSAVGIAGAAVIWGEHNSAPLTPATFRASAGAVEHARLCRVPSLAGFLSEAALAGVRVIGLEAQAPSAMASSQFSPPAVVVVGSEHKGLSRAVRRACTETHRLVATRGVASLNASVAAAVALYEIARQA